MKNLFLKLSIIYLFLPVFAFAIPGAEDYLPTESGEYVYYRDKSYPFEAYVGFLQYDDSTYAARYYAPSPDAGSSEVQILFTLNADLDYTEMTGERIVSTVTPDDTETVNYLHDLIYEFTARRRHVSSEQLKETADSQKKSQNKGYLPYISEENFPQFGGNVEMKYLFIIPIFNLKGIYNVNGEEIFSLVTMGRLLSSGDNGFSNFKGIPDPLDDKNQQISLEQSNLAEVGWNGFSILLDSQWTQSMENMWFLGDSAVLVLNTFSKDNSVSSNLWDDFLYRRMIYSSESVYANFPDISISKSAKKTVICNRYYHSEAGSVTRDIKIILQLSDTEYGFASLTIFDGAYLANKSYFDAISASYKGSL